MSNIQAIRAYWADAVHALTDDCSDQQRCAAVYNKFPDSSLVQTVFQPVYTHAVIPVIDWVWRRY